MNIKPKMCQASAYIHKFTLHQLIYIAKDERMRPRVLDFKEELKKYKPVLGMEDVEKSIKSDEVKDLMDLLQYLSTRITERNQQS